ncbi:MAG: glucosylceramidase [Polaribacter sp.]
MGTGFHWYEDWKDTNPMPNNGAKVNEAYPDKKLIFTEGCNEGYDLERLENEDPKLAERYGKSMIHDFNKGAVAWTDWNILWIKQVAQIMLVTYVLRQCMEIRLQIN